MFSLKSRLSAATIVVAATAAALVGGGTAYAVQAATSSITPKPLYACESSGHVAVTLLSTPSSKCPSGTTSIVVGAQGPAGPQGVAGSPGATGSQGPAGQDAQALPYGIARVQVDRGSGAATWATYSTTIGSPVGDTAGGAFRMTCNSSSDCKITVQAEATVSGVVVYPRVLIMKQPNAGGPEQYCEYADGADNSGATTSLTSSFTTLPMGIGGSLDCGSSQSFPSGGVVSEIDVPAGFHYDITTTLVFTKP